MKGPGAGALKFLRGPAATAHRTLVFQGSPGLVLLSGNWAVWD